jgi:phosphatidylinositol 4-kinase A
MVSSLAIYFMNDSINRHPALSVCMDSVADKVGLSIRKQLINYLNTLQVMRGCVSDLNIQATQQKMPKRLSSELQKLLVYSSHRVAKARGVASKFLDRLITSFPSLMCDPPLVFAILEVLTLLRRACENEYTDEVSFDNKLLAPNPY